VEKEYTGVGSRIGSKNGTTVVSNADDSGSHGMWSGEIDFLIHDSTAKQKEEEEEQSVKSALIKHKKEMNKPGLALLILLSFHFFHKFLFSFKKG